MHAGSHTLPSRPWHARLGRHEIDPENSTICAGADRTQAGDRLSTWPSICCKSFCAVWMAIQWRRPCQWQCSDALGGRAGSAKAPPVSGAIAVQRRSGACPPRDSFSTTVAKEPCLWWLRLVCSHSHAEWRLEDEEMRRHVRGNMTYAQCRYMYLLGLVTRSPLV